MRAHIEIAALRFDFEHLGKCLGPDNVEVVLRPFRIGRLGALLIQKQVPEDHPARLLQSSSEHGIVIAGSLKLP
jgi:hypothetical protein